MQVPKWDRTRRPEEQASPVGTPHPLHMLHGNPAQSGKKPNPATRSRSAMVKNWCIVLSLEGATVKYTYSHINRYKCEMAMIIMVYSHYIIYKHLTKSMALWSIYTFKMIIHVYSEATYQTCASNFSNTIM